MVTGNMRLMPTNVQLYLLSLCEDFVQYTPWNDSVWVTSANCYSTKVDIWTYKFIKVSFSIKYVHSVVCMSYHILCATHSCMHECARYLCYQVYVYAWAYNLIHAMKCGCKVYTLLKQSGVYLIPYMSKICHSSIYMCKLFGMHACMPVVSYHARMCC